MQQSQRQLSSPRRSQLSTDHGMLDGKLVDLASVSALPASVRARVEVKVDGHIIRPWRFQDDDESVSVDDDGALHI